MRRIAYYWPFAYEQHPVCQGARTQRDGVLRNDLSFRPALEQLREQWQQADGRRAADLPGAVEGREALGAQVVIPCK